MKTAFKGTDKDFKCRDVQFDLENIFVVVDNGDVVKYPQEFFKSNVVENNALQLCSKDGMHYCNNLKQVFEHYPNKNGNRFFEIEVLGTFKDNKDKSITTALRFIREILQEEILQQKIEVMLKLDKLRFLQEKFPQLIIGGSVSLYLQGIRLERLEKKGVGDFDLISPYYINLADEVKDCDTNDTLPSGCDFDDQFSFGGLKLDLKVDPHAKYHIVEYKGHKYKVGDFRDTLEAKIKYSKNRGGEKHLEDLLQLLKN